MNSLTPWLDPVVAEIHATRELLADQYHNDLLAYSKAAEAHCHALGLIMVEDQHHIVQVTPSDLGAGNGARLE
jgi:hypothetical protein